MPTNHENIQKVKRAVQTFGHDFHVLEFDQSTSTAQQAAQAIGTTLAQIVKSLVFKGQTSQKPILIITSGANRVDTEKVALILGEALASAPPQFVLQQTGFAIGGVPPVGHSQPLQTYIDQDLLQHDEIWASAGTPHSVFRLNPQQLLEMTSGQIIAVH